jgi:hypothetical protein
LAPQAHPNKALASATARKIRTDASGSIVVFLKFRVVWLRLPTIVLGWRILTRLGNVKTGKEVILVFDSRGNRS